MKLARSSAPREDSARPDLRSLIGTSVTLTITDPWDFETTHGNGPFQASVVEATPDRAAGGGGALLVRLAEVLAYQGNVCEYLIATPRSAADDFARLDRREGIRCSFVSISPQGAKSATPFDLAWWRGWGTFLGIVHAESPGQAPR